MRGRLRLAGAVGALVGLAGCGPETVSAPTATPTVFPATAAASPTPATTNTPTPPPTTATAAPTAASVSGSGAAGQTMTLTPGTLAAGSILRITGYDPTGCASRDGSVTILSNAFPGPQEFAGVHAVTATGTPDNHFSATVTIPSSTPAGSYPVTARCGGGNYGVALTLKVTPPG